MRKLIVGLFVFALLFILFIGTSAKEGFADGKTILTAENVLKLVQDTIVEYVDAYTKLKALKTDDARVKGRLQLMAKDINMLNEQYPAIEYTIQQQDYSKYPMVFLEDLTNVKNFFTTRVGLYTASSLTTPADIAEVDVLSNRIQSLYGFIQQKIPQLLIILPQNSGTLVRQTVENISRLKQRIGTLPPTDIPLLKSDLYWTAVTIAKDNFVFPSDLLKAPLIEIQTTNLPLPTSALKLEKKEQASPAPSAPPAASKALAQTPAACPSPPPCPECPKCPPPEGKRYSDLIKELLIEGDLLREFRNNPQ